MNIIKRFWKYVDKCGPNDCWEWVGFVKPGGHGRFWIKGKSHGTHRVSWAIAHHIWPIPKGLQINHFCDNKSCVNPAHLYLGTQEENTQDASHLTPENIKKIRHLHNIGYSRKQLSQQFNITTRSIGRICNHKTWKGIA